MNFLEYQEAVFRTMNTKISWREGMCNFLMGLAGEVGEVTEPVKKHLFHGKPLDLDKIKTELGDVLWYLTATADLMGFSLEDIAQKNADKLMARYPNGFNAKRHEEGDGA
jgi:NTP pyrophosphatase (non-canonical NTP hydrolase)